MKLSILICSIYKREDQLAELLESLFIQVYEEFEYSTFTILQTLFRKYTTKDIEILVALDNKQLTVGAKRNLLLSKAGSTYSVFIDDDDVVTDDYIKSLLWAIKTNYDVICFQVIYNPAHAAHKLVKYSSKFNKDAETKDYYQRLPNHLMCIKTDIAKKVKYPNIRRGEDAEYAKRLKPHIKTEGQINRILYYYNFDPLKTETQ